MAPSHAVLDTDELLRAKIDGWDVDLLLRRLPEASAHVLRMSFGLDRGYARTSGELCRDTGLCRSSAYRERTWSIQWLREMGMQRGGRWEYTPGRR